MARRGTAWHQVLPRSSGPSRRESASFFVFLTPIILELGKKYVLFFEVFLCLLNILAMKSIGELKVKDSSN